MIVGGVRITEWLSSMNRLHQQFDALFLIDPAQIRMINGKV